MNDPSNATTFCSKLEYANIDEKSATNFVQYGHTQSSTSFSSRYGGKETKGIKACRTDPTLQKESTFYGKASDDSIQNNVVTTTRKRSPFKDVQPAKPSIYDFDASIAEKRLRTLPSVSPSIDFWYLKNIS